MKTVLQEVKDRIDQLQAAKAAELETISEKQKEIRTQIEMASLAMRKATECMSVDDYETAKAAKRKAQSALDMYGARYKQIEAQEYISESESDHVIDSLLQYEEDLTSQFKTAIVKPLRELEKLRAQYLDEIADTEHTLTVWQRDIHANYLSRGGTSYHDTETDTWTERSNTPIPVHRIPYTGCSESAQMGVYLEKMAHLTDG